MIVFFLFFGFFIVLTLMFSFVIKSFISDNKSESSKIDPLPAVRSDE